VARADQPVSPVRRLHRLRWRLTLFFSLTSAFGLVVLTLVALGSDARLRDEELHREMERRVHTAQSLLDYDAIDGVDLSYFDDDDISIGSPQLYVLDKPRRGTGPLHVAHAPKRPVPDVGAGVADIATVALDTELDTNRTAAAADGSTVPLFAAINYDGGGDARVAIVAVGDPHVGADDQRRLALILWSGTAGLVLFSAAVGYAIAGRSIRPAAAAMKEQERFLNDAAHELRTPVARIRTAADAGASSTDPARAQAALQSMSALAAQAGEVVDNLLTLARMDAGAVEVKAEKMRLDQLVGDVVEQHPGVTFVGASSVVTADPALIRRAVDNLVTNAVRHGGGDQVTVTVNGPIITVADRGPGLDPRVEERLFDRFVTSPRTGGSGLGLSIVLEIARAHGGTVIGHNRADGPGAEFVISLPAP
jgi:two-component system OmpR family sensor kinase